MSEKVTLIREAIDNCDASESAIKKIVKMISDTHDLADISDCIYITFMHLRSNEKMREAALKAFLLNFKKAKTAWNFDLWIYALGHFTPDLWKMRDSDDPYKPSELGEYNPDQWLKLLYNAAFDIVDDFGHNEGSCRLIIQFGKYANWNDNPEEFGISKRRIKKADPHFMEHAIERVKAGKFKSEGAFTEWKEAQPKADFFKLLR